MLSMLLMLVLQVAVVVLVLLLPLLLPLPFCFASKIPVVDTCFHVMYLHKIQTNSNKIRIEE